MIGRFRKAGRQTADPVERFDPAGRNNPKGEWRLVARFASEWWKLQRARSEEAAQAGANRFGQPSRRAERAVEAVSRGAKWQARNVEPGMGASKRGDCCGGVKGRHEHPVPGRKRCGVL